MKKIIILLFFILTFTSSVYAENGLFPRNTAYEVCFTPGQYCTQMIVNYINQAEKSIYVQAYGFNSNFIANAIVNAKHRGVHVNVIIDRSQIQDNKYSAKVIAMLNSQQVPVWIDYKVDIAHNKIMIFDEESVLTGSFNFTQAAQFKNAENVLVITDSTLARFYLSNWWRRRMQSMPYNKYIRNH